MHRTQAQIDRLSERKRVAQATLDQLLTQVGDGLLTEDELSGLEHGLGRLFELATEMGINEKPLVEWSKVEVMRFLAIAVRAAVPLRIVSFTLATDNGETSLDDETPF